MWVRSIEDYSKALKIVAPKREKKRNAEEQLRIKMEYLATLESTFQELAEKLKKLEDTLNTSTAK